MFTKKCPECSNTITYANKYVLRNSIKRNSLCRECRNKPENNPFFGKHHDEATRKRLSDSAYKRVRTNAEKEQARQQLAKVSVRGAVYPRWVKKYGKQIADEKENARKLKLSVASSGSNNPMFGKPSPQGSGNGWSGWYKGKYFRSIGELSCIINWFEKEGLTWISAESKKFKISYIDWSGKTRNYFPDFLVNGNLLVESKPKRLWKTPSIIAKSKAAKKFCKANGYEFRLVDVEKVTFDVINDLVQNGKLRWLPKYQNKFDRLWKTKSQD